MATGTMRAGIIAAPGRAETTTVPIPEPGPGQVRVRIEGTGVCGSDLPLWEGRPSVQHPREPGMPGHEGWGRIDAVGPDVQGIEMGQRVTGLFGRAYAEYDLAQADQIVPLPAAVRGPFPGEPLACAVNAFRRSDVRAGQTVAVVGVGFLGALFVQMAARAGARVVAVSRRGYALKLAESMGARHVIEMREDGEALQEVERITGGKRCDRVIECTGKQAPLDLASKLTRERGTLVIAGYHQDGPRTVDMGLWNWRGLDVVNAHERDPQVYVQGMRDAIRLVQEGKMEHLPLITHEVPLAEIQRAFTLLRDRPDGFLKAVVRP